MARRRKKKLNTKLVLLLVVFFVMPVLLLVGYKVYKMVPRNPVPSYEKAVELLAAGDYDGAANNFQRAIMYSKKSLPEQNIKYRLALADMLQQRMLNDFSMSEEQQNKYFSTWRETMKTVLRMDEANKTACDALYNYYWQLRFKGFSRPSYWDDFISCSENKILIEPKSPQVFQDRCEVFKMKASKDLEFYKDAAVNGAMAVYCDPHREESYSAWASSVLSNKQMAYMPRSLRDGSDNFEKFMKVIARVYKAIIDNNEPSDADLDVIVKANPEDVVSLGIHYNPDSAQMLLFARSLAQYRASMDLAEEYFQQAVEAPKKVYGDLVGIANEYLNRASQEPSQKDEYLSIAERYFTTAHQEYPDKPGPLQGLAYVWLNRDNFDKASEYVSAGLELLKRIEPQSSQFFPQYNAIKTFEHYTVAINLLDAKIKLATYMKENSDDLERLKVIDESLEVVSSFLPPLEDGVVEAKKTFQIETANLRAQLALVRQEDYKAEELLRSVYTVTGPQNSGVAKQLITMALKHNQDAEALRIIKDLLTIDPENIDLLLQQAQIQMVIRDAEGMALTLDKLNIMSLDAAQSARLRHLYSQWRIISDDGMSSLEVPDQLDPTQVSFWLDRADNLVAIGQETEAMDIYAKLSELFPGNILVLRPMVVLMKQNGQMDQALAVIDEHMAKVEDTKLLELLKNVLTAPAGQSKQVQLDFLLAQKESASQQMQLAGVYKAMGDDSNYVKCLNRVIELNPKYSNAFDDLFDFTLSNGTQEEIERVLTQAKELNLHGVDGDYYLAQKYIHDKKYIDALDLIATIIDRRGFFSQAYSLRGQAQYQLGRMEMAKESFQRAWDISNTNVVAMLALAKIAEDQGMDSEHEKWVYRCWPHLPMNGYIRYHWLKYQSEKETPQKFANDCAVVARKYPDDPRVKLLLAKAYEDLDPPQLDKAESIYSDLYENYGDSDMALDVLRFYAQYLARQDRLEDAVGLCDKLVEKTEKPVQIQLLCSSLYSRAGKYDLALERIDKALGIDPDNVEALRTMGQYTLDTNSAWDKGIAAVEKLNETDVDDPDRERYFESLIELLMRHGELDRAEQQLKEDIKANGENALNLALLGQVSQSKREVNQALEYYNKAIDLENNQVRARLLRADIYRLQGRMQQSLEDLRLAYETRPTEQMAVLYAQRAREVYPDGRRSREILNEALTRHENSALLISTLASVQLFMRDWDSLESTLQRGKEVRPRMAQWYVIESEMWKRRNQQGKSSVALARAMELAPESQSVLLDYISSLIASGQSSSVDDVIASVNTNSPQMQSRLQALFGQAQYKLGHTARALAEIRSAMLAAPTKQDSDYIGEILVSVLGEFQAKAALIAWQDESSNPSVALFLAELYIKDAQRQDALDVLDAVETDNLSDLLRYEFASRKAAIHYELGNYQQAFELYSEALSIHENSVMVLNNLAYLLSDKMGKHAEAIKYAEAASMAAPMDPNISDTLGWIRYQSGDVKNAKAELRRSLEIRPVPAAYYHLGVIAEAEGDSRAASEYYQKGFDLVKTSPSHTFYNDLKNKVGM